MTDLPTVASAAADRLCVQAAQTLTPLVGAFDLTAATYSMPEQTALASPVINALRRLLDRFTAAEAREELEVLLRVYVDGPVDETQYQAAVEQAVRFLADGRLDDDERQTLTDTIWLLVAAHRALATAQAGSYIDRFGADGAVRRPEVTVSDADALVTLLTAGPRD